MTGNNVKLLTNEQLSTLKKEYSFTLENNKIFVKTTSLNRIVCHDATKSFHINTKLRKISFTLLAINIWKELYNEYVVNLIDVQQAVNTLQITFQTIDKDSVIKILAGQNIKIKER